MGVVRRCGGVDPTPSLAEAIRAPIEPHVDALAPPIEAGVDAPSAAFEPPLDPVSPALERVAAAPGRGLDPITAPVESLLHAIASSLEAACAGRIAVGVGDRREGEGEGERARGEKLEAGRIAHGSFGWVAASRFEVRLRGVEHGGAEEVAAGGLEVVAGVGHAPSKRFARSFRPAPFVVAFAVEAGAPRPGRSRSSSLLFPSILRHPDLCRARILHVC